MKDEPEKKGIISWISEALYEKVDTGAEEEAVPEKPEGRGKEPAPAAPASGPTAGSPTDLAARLRAEIAGRGQAFTQFLALAASFAEIIPDEFGRYRAAMKALEKTGNLTRNEVLQGSKDQLLALRSQREVFAGTVSEKREALRQQGSGVEGIRAQIAELQQTIGSLQAQEQGILRGIVAEQQKLKAAEEGFTALIAALEQEITSSREKLEKYLPG
jgi:hypothetical protein